MCVLHLFDCHRWLALSTSELANCVEGREEMVTWAALVVPSGSEPVTARCRARVRDRLKEGSSQGCREAPVGFPKRRSSVKTFGSHF